MKTELDSAWESAIHNAERARKAEAEVERLRAELAECREDAERYRHVRTNPAMLLHLSNAQVQAGPAGVMAGIAPGTES